jgi:hypothetical protein
MEGQDIFVSKLIDEETTTNHQYPNQTVRQEYPNPILSKKEESSISQLHFFILFE